MASGAAPRDLAALVARAADLSLERVPGDLLEHALRVVADTVGVMMAGGRRSEISSYVDGEGRMFQPLRGGGATLLTPGFPRADPETAAFVNGTAGTFLELDEGYRPTGHPAVHVLPAALAAAQALRASGRELLGAFLGGYEVAARLFEAYCLNYPLHPHGHFGAVGAAVAVARLMGADPEEPAFIAATLPLLSVWQPCYEGATARNAYAGSGAALGVRANRMAAAGFTGSREAQEAAFGGLVGEFSDPDALSAPVDPARLRISRNYLKFHSACALTHSALDAVLALGPTPAEEVVSVEVETVSNNLKTARPARPNELSARFSTPYAVAAAIVHGHTRPEAFVPEERVFELAERVAVRSADDLEDAWPTASPARVTLRLREETRSLTVDNPRGHHSKPPGPTDLREKFEGLVGGERAGDLYERLLALRGEEDVSRILEQDPR